MIKKISRYSLQQIFIESLEGCNSFQIINGLNPFHLTLNGKECYIYIKNLSPAYFSNPDIWRVQLPRREDFEVIKNSAIDFILLGYDSENKVYTTWHPKWTKQRLNKTLPTGGGCFDTKYQATVAEQRRRSHSISS